MITPLYRSIGPLGRKYGSSSLLSGLISYWKLDETTGNRADSHGTNTGLPWLSPGYAAGKIGNALESTNGSIYVDSATVPTNEMALSLWIYPTAGSITTIFQIRRIASNQDRYLLMYLTNAASFRVWNDSGASVANSRPATPINNWYHVYVQFNQSTRKVGISVNNEALFESTALSGGNPPTDGNRITIGSAHTSLGRFVGRIDEVALYNRILTTAERTTMYGSPAYPFA